MKYELQVNELLNKESDVIGAEVILYEREENGDLRDCLVEHEVFIEGSNFDDIEDRNFIIDEVLTNLDASRDSYKWHKATLTNYLD